MVGRDTQWRLALALSELSAHERNLEAVRHSLMHQRPFDPYTAFQLLDRRQAGYFASKDIQDFMQRNRSPVSALDAHLILRRYDRDSDGRVSYTDFQEAVGAPNPFPTPIATKPRDSRSEETALYRLFLCEKDYISIAQTRKEELMRAVDFTMRGVFRAIDTSEQGVLSCSDLSSFFHRLGFAMLPEDVTRVFRALDRDRDGKVDFADFVESLMMGEERYRRADRSVTEFHTSLRQVLPEPSQLSNTERRNPFPVSLSMGSLEKSMSQVSKPLVVEEREQPEFRFGDFLQLQVDAVRSLEEKKQNLTLKPDFHPLALFRKWDRNEGSVSASSFSEGLRTLGMPQSPYEAFTLLKRFDQDYDGRLSAEEFAAIFKPHSANYALMLENRKTTVESFAYETNSALVVLFNRYFDLSRLIATAQSKFDETVKTGVSSVFSRLTRENRGFFTEADLRSALAETGTEVSPSELKTLMRFYDVEKSGQVRFSSFVESVAPSRPPRVR